MGLSMPDIQVPNLTTVEAMKELEDDEGRRFDNAEQRYQRPRHLRC